MFYIALYDYLYKLENNNIVTIVPYNNVLVTNYFDIILSGVQNTAQVLNILVYFSQNKNAPGGRNISCVPGLVLAVGLSRPTVLYVYIVNNLYFNGITLSRTYFVKSALLNLNLLLHLIF